MYFGSLLGLGIHAARQSRATYNTLLGKAKPSWVYQKSLQCFITSSESVPSSCVRQHTYDVPAQRLLPSFLKHQILYLKIITILDWWNVWKLHSRLAVFCFGNWSRWISCYFDFPHILLVHFRGTGFGLLQGILKKHKVGIYLVIRISRLNF